MILFLGNVLRNKKFTIIAALIGIFLLVPFLLYLKTPESKLRFNEVNIFSDLSVIKKSNDLIALRKQKGFQHELVLVSSNGTEAVGISLWDHKDNAEEYHRTTYPEVQKLLSKVIEGTPQVKTYEVSTSTLQKTATQRG